MFNFAAWLKYVPEAGWSYLYFHLNWVNFQGPVHVIRYEHLQRDLKGEMRKLMQFLKMPISEKTLQCIYQNSEGSFHRQHNTKVDPYQHIDRDVLETLDTIHASVESAIALKTMEI